MERTPLHIKTNPFQVYKSSSILEHQEDLVKNCKIIYENIKKDLEACNNGKDISSTTWVYDKYNFWPYAMNVDPYFINLWQDLVEVITAHSPKDAKYALVQSWLNYDTYDSIESNLGRHNHLCALHGYIAIEPQLTKTVFDDWEVVNEVGNIYVGLGNLLHGVKNTGKYSEPRITIAYDVIYSPEVLDFESMGKPPSEMVGTNPGHNHWIPLLLN